MTDLWPTTPSANASKTKLLPATSDLPSGAPLPLAVEIEHLREETKAIPYRSVVSEGTAQAELAAIEAGISCVSPAKLLLSAKSTS